MAALINLDELTAGKVHNLSGHMRGLAARQHFDLDQLDICDEPVEVIVPEHIYGLSPSFVQGLFAASVQRLGNDRETFLRHYRFRATDLVKRQLERGLSAILTDRDFVVQ